MENRRTIVVYYNHQWGGNFRDHKWWTAYFEDTREVFDYHYKNVLIEDALKAGYDVKIMKLNRKTGKIELVKTIIAE
jgi:hypothetical protein